MSHEWTREQTEAITKQGDLLVSAAAGAGKTAVLTERIAKLVSSGVGVDELLVVTFTRAAASEMKERIAKRLLALVDEAAQNGEAERAAALSRSAASCENANISTIHSFCLNVLHRNYHAVGLDPSFKVAETLDAELLFQKALDEVLEAAYLKNETEKDPGFEALTTAVGSDRNLETLVRDLYKFAIARPDPEEWLDEAVRLYTDDFDRAAKLASSELMESVCGELQVFLDTAKELRKGPASEHIRIAQALDEDMSYLMGLLLVRDHDKWVKAISQMTFARLTWNRGTEPEEKADVVDYRDKLKDYHKKTLMVRFSNTLAQEAHNAELLAPPIACLRRIMGEFMGRYAELKAEEGLIDFSDMEQLTLRALSDERVAEEYRRRFRAVFIDEYQDINPAQEAILAAVSDGNRFMVGDVKQSIYRFRQAEPAIFLEKYAGYRGEDGRFRIDLTKNFRSRPAILDAANLLFSQLMLGGAVGEIDYSDNAALVPGRSAAGGDGGAVELCLIDMNKNAASDEGSEESEDDASFAEDRSKASLQASFAARRIMEIKENSLLHENDGARKYRWSDFAILLRAASPVAAEWLKTLSEAGIPCISDCGPDYFDAVEVRVFIDLLRVIDNRRQDIPLLAVMRSAIFGFTDEELIHVKADYEGVDIFERVSKAASDPASPSWSVKCAEMLKKLEAWREESRLMEPGAFIARVIDETHFEVFVSALPGGIARSGNVEELIRLAERFSASGRSGIGSFVRYLDASRDSSPAAASASPAVDAVRLMTIHHSKGLEFPVVILGDITKGFNRSSNSAVGIFDPRLGIGLCSVAGDRGSKSLLQKAIAFRELRRQNAEEMRMLYVAQTRARERLIMVGADADPVKLTEALCRPMDGVRIMKASSYADWMLGAYFPNGADIPVELPHGGTLSLEIIGARGAASARIGMSEDDFALWQQDAAFADAEGLKKRFYTEYGNAADTALPSKLSVTGLTLHVPEIAARPRFMAGERELTAADIGTLTHRLLQLITIAPHTETTVKEELEKLTREGLFSEREAACIDTDSVVRFFDSPLGRRLILSPEVLREQEFELDIAASELIGAATDTPIMLQGVIDCCFIEDGEWVLVDHKTTHVDRSHTPRTVAERYRRQLELYAAALEKLTGKAVGEKYIYLLSINEAVKL